MANKASNESKQHKRDRFLTAFAECGNISEAARISKCNRLSHYMWMEDSEYVKQFEFAKEQAIQELEHVARERAKKSSDLLLIFLLRSLRPDVYKDRREIENKGKINLTITEQIIMVMAEERANQSGNPRLKNLQN